MGIAVDKQSLFTLFYVHDQIVLAEDSDNLINLVRKLSECYEIASYQSEEIRIHICKNDIRDLPVDANNEV